MEDSCPATPLHVFTGRDSKSPLHLALSSPESDMMKSPSDRLSPDSRCVICLGRLQNKSFTDSCLHQFCFQCLLQWSKVKPECPLCKQPFKSIIHNVRSNSDYDQYHVERQETAAYSLSGLLHSYNIEIIHGPHPRHRYRSTMTPEYFRELTESFMARRRIDNVYQIPPLVPVDSAPTLPGGRANRHHHHPSSLRSSMRHRSTSEFRRSVYAQDLWVQDLADVSGRYRECCPQFYRDNPSQIHRVYPWLNREVNVLLDHCRNHAITVIDRILSILPQHSIRSREFKALVEPYFGSKTDHFVHEFYTFARSVYDMSGFDENAVYSSNPNYATEVQEISSSSDDDSDIEIIQTVKNGEGKTKASSSHGFKKILLKRAGGGGAKSSEPVAGPSGLNNPSQETIEVCESDPDDVEVLNYVKPEPELVTLSSGEEEGEGEQTQERPNDNSAEPEFDILNVLNSTDVLCSYLSSELSATSSDDSSESYHPSNETRKNKYKSPKGKCKSDGSGLKGKQKKKYVRKSKSSSCSSGGEEKHRRRLRRRHLISSSSSSSPSDRDTSPSDYEPIAKYLTKKKEIPKHKKTKKSSRRKNKKESKRKVKSCVVVPKKIRNNYETDEEGDSSSQPLESYWSQVKTSGRLTKIRLKRKRSNSSSSENSIRRVKYSSRAVSDDSSGTVSSDNNLNSSVDNVSKTDDNNSVSENQDSAGTNRVASSSSEIINIRINLSSDSSSDSSSD